MGFNIFASPFEKMSIENQQEMVNELAEINAAFSESSHPYFSAIINISDKINQLVEINNSIKSAITDGPSGSDGLKAAELQALGVTSEMFGKGLTMIVDAVKAYSSVDPKVFDNLIEGITNFADAVKKMEPAFKLFMEVPKVLGMLALGIIGLGIGLVISFPFYLVALPMLPIIILVISSLVFVLGTVFSKFKDGTIQGGAMALKSLAWSIVLFGLAIALSGPVYIVAMFSMVPILLVLSIFLMVFSFLSAKFLRKTVKEGAMNLKQIAWTIALFGIAIALIGPLYVAGAVFILPIVLTLLLFVGLMFLISKVGKNVREGVISLWMIGVSIVIFGLALYFWNKLAPSWDDIFQTIIVIGAFAAIMYLVGQKGKDMMQAAIALIISAASLIVLAIALKMLLEAVEHNWENIGMVGAIIGGFAGVMMLVGNFGGNIIYGAVALLIAAGAMIVLGFAIKTILDSVERNWEQIGMVAAVIAGFGLTMLLFGISPVPELIMYASVAMLVASAALVLIGVGLKTFKNSGWEIGDEKLLMSALGGIRNAYLGLNGDEGLIAAAKAIGKSMALSAAMVPISLMYIPAAMSLVLIGLSLEKFKKIGFGSADADNLKYVIRSVADAFTAPFLNKYGLIDYAKLYRVSVGVQALSKAGTTLAGLAEGVQEWANLTAPVWEYDEKSGEMKIKRKVKLTKNDFKRMAFGMQEVIGAISGPFAEVGKLEMGGKSNDPFYNSIFGGKRYVSKGVRALQHSGKTLADLATGVQAWANLTVIEYDVVETKDGPELRPVRKHKLTNKEIKDASMNAALVTMSMAKVFAEVGRLNEGETATDDVGKFMASIFGGNYIKKGVESLSGIGTVITGLASGIQSFAKMEYISHKVMINPKTGMPEMVPDKIVKLTQGDIETASFNIADMAHAMAVVFAEIGQDHWGYGNQKTGIDPDDIKNGITSLTGIGSVISGLAEGIQSFAKMEFTQNEIKMVNGIPTLVPKKVIQLSRDDLILAADNIYQMSVSSVRALGDAGSYINKRKDVLKIATDNIPTVNSVIMGVADSIIKTQEAIDKVNDFDLLTLSISNFISSTISPFDIPDIDKKMVNLTLFADNTTKIGAAADDMVSIAKSFDGIAKSMGVFKDEINDLDIEILQETKALFQAMAIVAEAGSVQEILAKFGGSIEETFEKLAELLSRFADTVSTSSMQTANSLANLSTEGTEVDNTKIDELRQREIMANMEVSNNLRAMISNLESIDSQLRTGIKTTQKMF